MSGVVDDFFVHGRGPQRQRCIACPGLRRRFEPWTFGRYESTCKQHFWRRKRQNDA
jgi:hypothetical protein